ncbi:MAG: GMC family oxidoreductase [Deltaproteobacteria bacterium]|nr:GMC family oxidoreductase [Deltaproteobacteria bacterium]MCB2186320.1 GMC family oxidoreductase [Deltaproteobacteria bacterium]
MSRALVQADVAVAGSGPGGATVARALAQAGRKVVLLEKGRWHRWVGNHAAVLGYADRLGLARTVEGIGVVRGLTAGGSTILYCGAATPPPEWFKTAHGLDLEPYLTETLAELHLEPLPDEVVGAAALRLLEAGDALGHGFQKLLKFIDPRVCRARCGGTCMLGCPHGAKWTARAYLGDVLAAGGEVLTRATVERVLVEDGRAAGLVARTPRGSLEVRADTVILAAGGLGTPVILQNSGLDEAGRGLCLDPLVFVSGVSRHQGTALGPPMSVGTYKYMEEGVLLSDLVDPWGMWLMNVARHNPGRLGDFPAYRRQLGLMVKVADAREGSIDQRGRISKPLTTEDRARLARGVEMSKQILLKAGCRSETIIVGPVRGAHPMSTAPLGQVVDENLQTRLPGLYVSDASVMPRSLGRPVVLTLICLGKRLGKHLVGQAA